MDNGQAQYVGDNAVGNQVNNSGGGTDPVQIRTLNDVQDSAVAMDEGQALRNSDGSQARCRAPATRPPMSAIWRRGSRQRQGHVQ